MFYTPTQAIPHHFVGSGPLEVDLPIATPTDFEFQELKSYRSPRFWVDLLQRATGKLRWTPMSRVHLTIHRFDIWDDYGINHLALGTKTLTDALKVSTHGRVDLQPLYYFGAIVDDNPEVLMSWHIEQHLVNATHEACCKVIVIPSGCDS